MSESTETTAGDLTPTNTQELTGDLTPSEKNGEEPAKSLLSDQPDQSDQDDSTPDGPPDEYTFTHPEGQELKLELLNQFTDLARELGLSNEKAQSALDWYRDKVVSGISADLAAQRTALIEGWTTTIKGDPELGGARLKATIETAKSFVKEYPRSAEFLQLMDETGLGNHPEMIRFLHHWGNGLKEDRTLIGTRTNPGKVMTQDQFTNLRPGDRAKFINSGGRVE